MSLPSHDIVMKSPGSTGLGEVAREDRGIARLGREDLELRLTASDQEERRAAPGQLAREGLAKAAGCGESMRTSFQERKAG
ncbi:hypothetical protein [Myxococcus stipitatus]|uniref:hypothetical protein n=1 Tax=Myxococcus stipitatus TaxID=83455 RepID=UPI001185BF8D|nr:hypothetical protein [Myxococcus stipitatus]